MPELTIPKEYLDVWIAVELGLTPGEFRLLPWDEQAQLTAFFMVKQRISEFYQDIHEQRMRERLDDE